MKKLLLWLLAGALCLPGLCACTAQTENEAPVTVNETPVDAEVFRYFLDESIGRSHAGRDAAVNEATQACIRYVAVNTVFSNMELSLSPAERVRVSEEVNALWNLFAAHYRAVGVSKETLYKIRTSNAYTEKLRLALYDTNGREPIAEETLKTYFEEHYVAVRYLDGYLYTTDAAGVRKGFSEESIAEIRTRFEQAAAQLNAGGMFEPVAAALSGSMGIDMREQASTEVADAQAAGFPRGFFSAVQGLQTGKAGVLILDAHIYLVRREDILADDALFKNYRDACLRAVSEAPLQAEIGKLCEGFTSVRNTRLAHACCAEVMEGRKKK